jgi:hypothetical protein
MRTLHFTTLVTGMLVFGQASWAQNVRLKLLKDTCPAGQIQRIDVSCRGQKFNIPMNGCKNRDSLLSDLKKTDSAFKTSIKNPSLCGAEAQGNFEIDSN